MLPESITAILTRNETWNGEAATEPYEAGWAREAVIFIRALKTPIGPQPVAEVQMSPDGIRWIPEGTYMPMPTEVDGLTMARVAHFGNWLRVVATFDEGAESTLIATLHLKS